MKAARKDFEKFPAGAQDQILAALTIAAEGEKADIAKPLKGFGPSVLEVALRFRGGAYRTVYALKLHDHVWVIHAFQKKSPKGIKTAQKDIDLIEARIKRLKKELQQ